MDTESNNNSWAGYLKETTANIAFSRWHLRAEAVADGVVAVSCAFLLWLAWSKSLPVTPYLIIFALLAGRYCVRQATKAKLCIIEGQAKQIAGVWKPDGRYTDGH